MAVRAKHLQIFYPIIKAVAVYVMQFERDRSIQPIFPFAPFTLPRLQTVREQSKFEPVRVYYAAKLQVLYGSLTIRPDFVTFRTGVPFVGKV